MRILLLLFFLITWEKSHAQNSADSLSGRTWRLVSIDSAGKTILFPAEKTYILEEVDFTAKDCDECALFWRKNRKVYKKLGWKGMYIHTDEQNAYSKYYAQIKAFCKTEGNQVKLLWDDNFKVQEQLNKIDPLLSLWMLTGLNASGTILKKSSNAELRMEETNYRNEKILITFRLAAL
jgi:hypothetical protein